MLTEDSPHGGSKSIDFRLREGRCACATGFVGYCPFMLILHSPFAAISAGILEKANRRQRRGAKFRALGVRHAFARRRQGGRTAERRKSVLFRFPLIAAIAAAFFMFAAAVQARADVETPVVLQAVTR
jgi:hypothetical protein